MVGEKSNLKSFNHREISEKNYFGQESINNRKGDIIPLNTSSAHEFFAANLIWDLNYKHCYKHCSGHWNHRIF